jgi:glycosyltransferase involved in cell wall biosynthesis
LSDHPLVSIITAVKNGADFLQYAIESVQAQTYNNIEYIMIDGDSKDATNELISKYLDHIDIYISEPDNGIADAWNKGIKIASGDIIAFLNYDDYYHPDAVRLAVNHLSLNEMSISYGEAHIIDRISGNYCLKYDQGFDPKLLHYGFGIVHTTCFVPKAVYDTVGLFSEKYSIAIDTDFLLRALHAGCTFSCAGNITFMRNGGISDMQRRKALLQYYEQLLRYGYPKRKIARAFLKEFMLKPITSSFHNVLPR